jgi:hypothetical protein
MTCVLCIDVDTIICLFVCADVGPHGHEFELMRASARQGPVRPPRGELWVGERRNREEVEARIASDERASKRHHFDDPGVGPSHAPLVEAGGDFEDIHRRLEAVLQGVPKGMWSHIQDKGILEQCVGVSLMWQTIVRRAAVAGAAMIGWLPPGPKGPIVGGAPPPKGGAGGGALEAP